MIKILAIVAMASIAALAFLSLWMVKTLNTELNRKRTERARQTRIDNLNAEGKEPEAPTNENGNSNKVG